MFKGSINDLLDRLCKAPNVFLFAIWLDKRLKPFLDKSVMIGQTLYCLNGKPCCNFIGQTPRRFEKWQWRFKKRRLWTVFVSFFKRFRWQKNRRCHCTSDTEAPFLDLHLSISNGFVSSKINNKRDDFDFDIVNFPFLDGDAPRSASYGVNISQLIRFATVPSHVVDFNAHNKSLTAKLLQQGYRYHKLRKTFSKFNRRHYELVSKFSVGLKTLFLQGLSEPEFYGDLVYKFKRFVGRADFSDQFRKNIVRYKRIGYNTNIMRQSACLVFNPITVNNFASHFICTPVDRASLSDGPDIKLFILIGLGRSFFVCCLAQRGVTVGFLLLQCSSGVVRHPRDLQVSVATRFCRVLIFASS